MNRALGIVVPFFAAIVVSLPGAAARAGASSYQAFTASGRVERGLFPIWQKDGDTFLELAPNQLDVDFLETIAPGNGIAEAPLWWGDTDYLPTQVLRFERRGESIVMIWRNWYAHAGSRESARLAIDGSFPDSVVGVSKIVAEDPTSGHVIFDLSPLLADNLDVRNILAETPMGKSYRLDSSDSYVDSTKAFPENDVITVAQSWATDEKHQYDSAPDARRVLVRVVYNLIAIPSGDYRPRLMDDRVGLYDDFYIDFSTDTAQTRRLPYIVRWNFDPANPAAPSLARHPMVLYISNSVPPEYRSAIRDGCLEWNKALARAGILDAIQVRQQPNDPDWDPDDFRYSVIRWIDELQPAFGASSQTLFNPMTGEEFRTGILISGYEGSSTRQEWTEIVDPVRYGRITDPVPAKFIHDAMFRTVVHEMGHNLGMQHNFIGHEAYSAADLQSIAFTRAHGVASSVMEYAPINLWPQPYPQGEYFQTTIGPYDYYAIKFGYAAIPGAQTPEQEVPTLRRWAQAWSNPWTRYASDEDVDYATGHAADPRVEAGMLTNDPLAWCNVQMQMYRAQIASLNKYWPAPSEDYQQERSAFAFMLRGYDRCADTAAHYLGGQYLSWAHAGDPGAAPPIVPVPRATERRAMDILDRSLFDPAALSVPASTLSRLRYTEWSGYSYTSWEGYGNLPTWAYDPPARHDYPFVEAVNKAQLAAIDYLFNPVVLQRIDENPMESAGPTMTLADLFDWLHDGIFNDLRRNDIPLISRNLQSAYVDRLAALATKPAAGTPSDAQALAQAGLQRIARDASAALRAPHDAVTQAHLTSLAHAAKAG
jgi:hypothetical protein